MTLQRSLDDLLLAVSRWNADLRAIKEENLPTEEIESTLDAVAELSRNLWLSSAEALEGPSGDALETESEAPLLAVIEATMTFAATDSSLLEQVDSSLLSWVSEASGVFSTLTHLEVTRVQ